MRRTVLCLLAAAACAPAARAADLPAHSRLGAVFAEPEVVVARPAPVPLETMPRIMIAPLPGYYGDINSFAYRSYYGTSPVEIFGRLPYACGLYGYC